MSAIYPLAIILAIVCASSSSIPIKTERSKESFIKNNEEFIPTNEWQVVKEGQAIPPGLHVRLNLQTGLREAKLLENTQQSNDLVAIAPNEKAQEQISRENLERAFANLDLSKDDVPTKPEHVEDIKKKYRSYDEIKNDFKSLNLKVQTDQEILIDLLDKLKQNANDEDRKTILTDLEFYLHQYDNARFFSDMNGLDVLLQLLNSSQSTRQLTSLALGAAFQGNPQVQSKALELGFIPSLLRLLNNEDDANTRIRLLFTLSTLIRNCPQGQDNFLRHGGIETLLKLFDQSESNPKLKLRTIELFSDLIQEKNSASNDKQNAYKNINIHDELIQQNWCSRLSSYLSTINSNDIDRIEKILLSMISFADVCRHDWISVLPIVDRFLANSTSDNLKSIQNFRTNLSQTLTNDLDRKSVV